MTIKNTLKKQINQAVARQYNLLGFDFDINYPPTSELGDYASNAAMILGQKLKRSPLDIASGLAQQLARNKMWEKVEAVAPGFLNFYLSKERAEKEMGKILKQGKKYGGSNEGRGKTVVIDYSAPNIAKKMHVGHLRSTVIGAAIYNLYKFIGYKVVGDNHLGDWGTQFGKLICQYKKIYGQKIKKDISVEEMERLYLDWHKEAKEKPEMEEAARKELKKLQDKDKFNYALWQLFYKVSLEEFKRLYELLRVKFEAWHGESFYNPMLPEVVAEALGKKVAAKSEGAIIIDLAKYNLPPLMIQKTDGAFLYGTTDLATIKYREKHYHPSKNIYVVANQQALHFEQLFKAGKLLGYNKKMAMVHVKFGLILGRGGKKMSTRDGEVADLIEIIKEGKAKAKTRIQEKNNNLQPKEMETIAEAIALGAIKFNDLSQNRLTDIVFDWDKMLNFESGSAPYLQYTYVRIQSIFKKIKKVNPGNKKRGGKKSALTDCQILAKPTETKLIKALLKFPEAIASAAEEYKPNIVASYLTELAVSFHSFYEQTPVLSADSKTQLARLKLITAVAQVMKTGLSLLGIETPDKM